MTPARDFLHEWNATTERCRFPCRQVRGLGHANLCFTREDDVIYLSFICVEIQGERKGTRLLKIITDIADRHGVRLEVSPSKSKFLAGPTGQKLVDWYKKYGFTERSEDGLAWVRVPVSCVH